MILILATCRHRNLESTHMQRATFIERWSRNLERGSASVFIGAGLSQAAGYPSWRGLLRDIAKELGLDIEVENDLAAVAQYSINKAGKKRTKLAQLIVDEFPPKQRAPETFNLLARLPLRDVWTTNYDNLAEIAWRNERKHLDVKSRNSDLGLDNPWAHATLYKMHGSIEHPSDLVIAKDDYELYRIVRPGFLQLLTGHLISKQILFLGFSFTDPNLAHLFANIRESFENDGPEHYAIIRRPQRGAGKAAGKKYKTDKIRHDLWVDDLQRYGIQCIEVDEYEEINEILTEVAARISSRSVFVAGSFPDTRDSKYDQQRWSIIDCATQIGSLIAKKKLRLVSGFGLTVGSATLSGALNVLLNEEAPNIEKALLLRPFPQPTQGASFNLKTQYRQGMIQQAGIFIVIGGLKLRAPVSTDLQNADGVFEEFEIASKLGCAIIPIGTTGGVARKIWEKVAADFPHYWPPAQRKNFDLLNKSGEGMGAILKAVDEMIVAAGKRHNATRSKK